jgi:protein CpxP
VKSVRSILVVMAAGLALAVGIAFAQNEGGQGTMHHGMHGGMHGHMMGGELGMFLHQLNLTDDQKAQVKQIFQTEKPNIKPLMQQEMQSHLQLMQLIASGKQFDQGAATAIATQEARTHIQMEVEHAKIGAQIYQLLSSDQKAKVADMIAKHQQRMQEHLQNKEQTAPNEQQ